MSSLLNNASLLLNPAGSIISYQEDKIYSVLPKDGTGDFTFSGGDGGTRVNQQGYIEQTPANLMTYSEDVSNWTGNLFNNWIQNAVTSNIVIAPNGTLTGDRLGDGYGRFNVSATAIPGQTYTYSVYLKNVSLSANFYIYVAWGLNGTLVSYTTVGGQINVGALSTTEWTRFTFTATAPSSGINQMQFGPCPFTGYGTNPSGQQLDVWGGMINISSTALPYQPTTDRLNYPRITYQNGRGALLSEPQRTNLLTYSNGFDLWSYAGITVTAGSAISPDGTQNAFLLTTTNATNHQLYQAKSTSGALAYSVWAKKGNSRTFYLAAYNNNFAAYWDLDTGAVISTAGSGVSALPGVQYKDGWMLYTMLFTNVNNEVQIGFLDTYYTGNNPGPWGVSTSVGTTGYIYGAQLEAGTYPTSYIPTTSATVTRPTDKAFRYSATSLIGQSEGTVYFDFTLDNLCDGLQTNQPVLWYMKDGGAGERYVELISGNKLVYIEYNGAVIANIQTSAITAGRHKCAIAYANNDMVFYVDGVQIGTDTSGTPSGFSTVSTQYYNSVYDGQCKAHSLAPYTSRLTNTQLQELTTVRSGSGGTISYYGPYTIHTFTGSATFTPSFNGEVEVLVVAGGGGGGGWYYAGGGGAGGVLYASSFGVSQGTGVTVTVGAGGAQQTGNAQPGNDGSTSSFGGLSAVGGGGGGGGYFGGPAGRNGGSGGGGGRGSSYSGGLGISGQGNNGGNYNGWAGGGGGAGEAGATGANNANPGNGGDGLPYSITGFSTYYGGGGAGAVDANIDMPETVIPQGGLGGGGNGATYTNLNTAAGTGVTNTGGGGGGGCHAGANPTGAAGGSGIVIIRYLT